MPDRQEFADALEGKGIFAEVDRSELDELVEVCEPLTVMPGQPLWAPGDAKDAAYILVSGRVEISYRVQPDGQRKIQYTEPGQLLTLSSLVHAWEHGSAGTPLERSQLLSLSQDDFRALFEARHAAAFLLVDAIAEDLVDEMRDANRRLHEVFGHPAETLRMLRRRSRDVGRG
jgi:CRP/FNR family transcriptional regulator, cyclic AMP receptor protein